MKLYRVATLVRFGLGTKLTLTASQIDARRHALEAVDMHGKIGTATVKSLIEFKVGEVIGLERELSRVEQDSLEPEGEGGAVESKGAGVKGARVKKPAKAAEPKTSAKGDQPPPKPDDKPDPAQTPA